MQLETVVVNLALNARDAMPDGGKLTIEANNVLLDDDYHRNNPEVPFGAVCTICVTDTGVGMPADILERAFEPFFTTKAVGEGTGLGLSQVYGFIKQSGGHVKIYSEVSQGTTVNVYLPRRTASADETEAPLQQPISGDATETILVVEDNHGVRDYIVETSPRPSLSGSRCSKRRTRLEDIGPRKPTC